MKRVIYLFLVMPLFFYSCESIPEAYFYTDNIKLEVGQEVHFINDSHNAKIFEWDFGDGFISNEKNPIHIYSGTGTFEVTLTATSKSDLSDKATLTLKILIPTLLEIEVREYTDNYTVADASVFLYPTLPDWDAQINITCEGYTDADGIVVFSNLDPFVYYVDVFEQNHDNYQLRNEDVGFIRTSEIIPNKINWFIAWVDYVDQRKGVGREARKYVIKKIERKAEDKSQPSTYSESQDWKELYNRRAKQK